MGKALAPYRAPSGLLSWVLGPVRAAAAMVASGHKKAAPRAAYEGAVHNRLTWDWIFAPILSGNQEIRTEHRTLVGRSRDLVRNDAHARRYIGLLEVNVVGPQGIRLQAQARRDDDELDQEANAAIEEAWTEWGKPENCTTDGILDLVGVQRAVIRGWARDGEFLCRKVPGYPNRFGYAIQLLDPDQLDVDFNRQAGENTNEVRMGVEVNAWGRPVAFHLWSSHPGDYARPKKRERIPASQIVHYYDQDRPGQTRNVPRFAAILQTLRMLHGYREAEVVAARTAAAKMGFFEQDPEVVTDPNAPDADADLEIQAEPGKTSLLPPGIKFVEWSPEHPTTAFDSFEKAVLRTIATGLDTSYSSLTGDLSDVNYSSIRAGLLVERDFYRTRQMDIAARVLRPIYLDWLLWAMTSGALALDFTRLDAYRAHTWRGRGWAWVDPEKDVRAALLAIEGKLDSRTRVVAENGYDFEDVLEELAAEEELAADYGIKLTNPQAPTPPPSDAEDEDEGRGTPADPATVQLRPAV